MIEGLKSYPQYKESGSKWLGPVPAHWSLLPNRAIFDEVKDRGHATEEMLSVTITRGIVRQRALLADSSKKDSSNTNKSAYKLVQPNDIAYNKMRAWQGALGASCLRGIISPAYVVMRPKKDANPWFYHSFYRTPLFTKEAERWSYGITSDMWSLRPEHFKVIGSVLPPPDEQAAIVRFLDHANRKIDGFIRAKRKLIGLLNEQKQAIIHRAVTRGLDPNAQLKPSGIPWLGEIPEHWEMRRLKTLSRFVTSGSRGWGDFYSEKGSIFLRIGNISTTSIDLRLDRISYVNPPADGEGERTRARSNDILLSITAQIGAVGVVPEGLGEAFVNQHTALIRLRTNVGIPRWIAYVLISRFGKQQCQLLTNGGTKIGLTLDDVRCLNILCPPISEQEKIVAEIEQRSIGIATAIARTEREIALMQEYRTRLTADIVTGKLDVREAAAKLPDLVAEEAADSEIPEEETELEEAEV